MACAEMLSKDCVEKSPGLMHETRTSERGFKIHDYCMSGRTRPPAEYKNPSTSWHSASRAVKTSSCASRAAFKLRSLVND